MIEKIRGSAHVGHGPYIGYHASWPFCFLNVSPTQLEMYLWPKMYVFPKDSLLQIIVFKHLFFRSLLIIHDNPEYPKCVIFRPFQWGSIETILAEKGYFVDPEGTQPQYPAHIHYSFKLPKWLWLPISIAVLGLLFSLWAVFQIQ